MEFTIIVVLLVAMLVCAYFMRKTDKQLKGINEYKARTSNFASLIESHVIVSTEQLVSEYDRVAEEMSNEGYDTSWYPNIREVFEK